MFACSLFAMPLRARRRLAAWLGLVAVGLALIVASFAGLGVAAPQETNPDELVICTPGGLKVINLLTGEIRLAQDNTLGKEQQCVLTLPLASVAALLVGCLLCILPIGLQRPAPDRRSSDERPHYALAGFDHRPRAPPSYGLFA